MEFHIPPLNSRKTEAPRIGTVKLSNPKGERASARVATKATTKAVKVRVNSCSG